MNKKLLAVAVVGALASPAAFAQTTLYGVVDVGYQHASGYRENPSEQNKNFVEEGQHSPSRLGVRGSEDLAGGTYAMYGLEMNMPADTGAAVTLTRLAYVGLGSKAWGELTLGRQYTHSFHTFAVGSAHAYGTFASAYAWSSTPTRASNSIKYSSPVFNGFSAGVIWSPSSTFAGAVQEPNNTTTKANYYDGAIRWTPGPFGVAVSYAKDKTEVTGLPDTELKLPQFSANWDNKAFGIYGNYQKPKLSAGGLEAEATIWSLSGVARFGGVHEIYALYGRVKDKSTDDEATTYGIVYENVLSKRTHAYVGYGKTNNDAGLNIAPTNLQPASKSQILSPSTNVTPGSSPTGFQVGIVHTF